MTFSNQYVIGYTVVSFQSLQFIKKLSLLVLDQLVTHKFQLVYVSKMISNKKKE